MGHETRSFDEPKRSRGRNFRFILLKILQGRAFSIIINIANSFHDDVSAAFESHLMTREWRFPKNLAGLKTFK